MERVLLVGLKKKGAQADAFEEASLEELKRLAETAGAQVRAVFTQSVDKPNPATLIGAGKVVEIAAAAREEAARAVIFNEDLSPAQQRNLEERINAKILDRTRLILDIFAGRARTREGALQVELAQLEYLLPRLTGKGVALSQQVGGIGTRGPGERKLEYERRRIRDRIHRFKREIEGIRKERDVQRRRRLSVPFPTAALIGYTNVGKSTLLNALSGARVYADDRLFATLDPTTRRVRLPSGGWALFTDTVGFIQKLPTTLVAAFRATLEEVVHADCIVHVVDAADPSREAQTAAVQAVLAELDTQGIPQVRVYNKADALSREARSALSHETLVSAAKNEGLDELLLKVEHALERRWMRRTVVLEHGQAGLVEEIYRNAQVLHRRHKEGRTELDLRVTPENFARLRHKLKP